MRQAVTMILICVFLMTHRVQHLLVHLFKDLYIQMLIGHSYIFFGEISIKFFAHLKIKLFALLLSFKEFTLYSRSESLIRHMICKYFPHSLKKIFFNLFILIGGQLLYNIVLVLPYINMNPPWVYTCSPSCTHLPLPSPYHPSGSSQCTSPEHPVSCIEPGLVIHCTYDIIHVSMPFSQIIPPSPSPTESKRLF